MRSSIFLRKNIERGFHICLSRDTLEVSFTNSELDENNAVRLYNAESNRSDCSQYCVLR